MQIPIDYFESPTKVSAIFQEPINSSLIAINEESFLE